MNDSGTPREPDGDDFDLGGDDLIWPDPASERIPEDLHSTYSGAPFESCLECSAPLLEGGDGYVIQKVYRDGETIFEFAMCLACSQLADSGMSEESRRNVETYFAENAIRTLGLDTCNLCGETTRDSTDEYVLVALAYGHHVVGAGHMVCEVCTSTLESLLSETTRRDMEDFTNRNFPGVPETMGLPVGVVSF